jgi:DNA-binding GntR family transcriptional regulator
MPLSRVRRVSLAHSVSSQLSRAIVAGDFPASSQLSEPSLAATLGVSRAPVREALIELELRGLVEFDPQGHTRVPTLTPADLQEIHALRLAIDPLAASLAAEHATADVFAALEANIAATKDAKTLADVSRLDADFHDRIVKSGRNRRLMLCWSGLRDQVELWLTQMQLRHQAITKRTRQQTVDSHNKLLEVIRSGDPKQAAALAGDHVAGWIELLPTVTAVPKG